MYLSFFEMYKIGIGPSSSHTFGPMIAAHRFTKALREAKLLQRASSIKVGLYGSLSATGRGHLTDTAIILGLSGYLPESIEIDKIATIISATTENSSILLDKEILVGYEIDFLSTSLPLHENGLRFTAYHDQEELYTQDYYSIGGGFVKSSEEFDVTHATTEAAVPFQFSHAKELVALCGERRMSDLLMENESTLHTREMIEHYADKLWQTMDETMERGISSDGTLPSPTGLQRRAKALLQKLQEGREKRTAMMEEMDWVNLFAIAVSEENANGGRVVTAPTNGACGIIPAVLRYYDRFIQPLDTEALVRFFLVSSAIGALYKQNASISGAEVGCQGEVGVASSMAAGGLTELLGADATRVSIAAEIAMEHHLGLTCDPVNGQVQIPCIERNGVAAVTAINAAAMALSRNENNTQVSLDRVVEAMRQTGKDMDAKYRETSCGGLAVTS